VNFVHPKRSKLTPIFILFILEKLIINRVLDGLIDWLVDDETRMSENIFLFDFLSIAHFCDRSATL
jgi:hypothetical protein